MNTTYLAMSLPFIGWAVGHDTHQAQIVGIPVFHVVSSGGFENRRVQGPVDQQAFSLIEAA